MIRTLIIVSIFVLAGCTPLEEMSKKTYRYEVVKIDSTRSFAYPFDFNRARDLRAGQMFTSAAYVYIHLFPSDRDSVIEESIRMSQEIRTVDTVNTVAYYFQQALGEELLKDPAIRPSDGKVNQQEMKRRYTWTSELINALEARGIK